MKFSDLPELTFASADPQQMDLKIVGTVEGFLGRTLERADPLRLYLRGVEAVIIQLKLLVDKVAKQNLLYYAEGENLRHIGILTGVERLQATAATSTVEVTLSAARPVTTIITQGTRIHAGDNIYFALDTDVIFLAGETSHTAKVTCQQVGVIGNHYAAGELNRIVDPQPFLASIINLTETGGGSDVESDYDYRERIRQAPESFSNAGSSGAYEFFTRSASSLIDDVLIVSENPAEVDIYVLLENGELPNEEILNLVNEILTDRKIRPLTDKVKVKSPEIVNYNLEVRYLIATSDRFDEAAIISKVQKAVEDFVQWQKSKIGRDFNDTELYWRIRQAGAKRAQIVSPAFFVVEDNQVAVAENISVAYEGLEKD